MAEVEEELWNIFTFYTLRGNPLDLTRLSVTQFLRLARDCQIVGGGRANIQGRSLAGGDFGPEQQGERRLGQAAVNLAFASVIQGRSKVIPEQNSQEFIRKTRLSPATTDHTTVKSKLTYPEFLDALVVLGERLYRRTAKRRPRTKHASSTTQSQNRKQSVESAFQQLLMEHILPLASRRRPSSISTATRDPLVRDLLRHHGPALKEMFRFYAVSSSTAPKRSPPDNSKRGDTSLSREADNGKTTAETIPDGAGEQTRQQHVVPGSSLESAPTWPQSPNAPSNPGAPGDIEPVGGGALSSCSVPPPDKSTIAADVAAGETLATAGETLPSTEIANSTTTTITTPTTQPPNTRTSRCPSSITWSFSQEKISTSPELRKAAGTPEQKMDDGLIDGDGSGGGGGGGGGIGGTSDGQGEQRRRASSARSSRPACAGRAARTNSMADALSHQCLLHFAADFGISGALLSTLEVGEIYLSCDGGLTDLLCGEKRADKGVPLVGCARRTGLARAAKGRIRPLTFPDFLEALVRISLACFRPTGGEALDAQHRSCEESIGPGQCLRALLTHMWRRLRASSTLALNGVREGGARHRSSIQKGALLRGVQLFNEQMLSSCRTDGFLDLSTTSPICTSLGGSLRYAPRQGCAAQMLRDLLALDQSHDVEAETGAEPDENGLQRHREEEAGCGGEGKTVASPASRCQVDACSS